MRAVYIDNLLYCKNMLLSACTTMVNYPVLKNGRTTSRGKFWHGEMMFCTNHINMDVWAEQAQEVIKKLKGKKLKFAKSMPLHQIALVLYIETLFSKWCPYDDMSWIFEY